MLLDAVTLVTALAALAGLVAAVAAPVLRLNSAITRLSTLIDRALRDMEALKERDEELRRSAKESHERLHSRIDRAGERRLPIGDDGFARYSNRVSAGRKGARTRRGVCREA